MLVEVPMPHVHKFVGGGLPMNDCRSGPEANEKDHSGPEAECSYQVVKGIMGLLSCKKFNIEWALRPMPPTCSKNFL